MNKNELAAAVRVEDGKLLEVVTLYHELGRSRRNAEKREAAMKGEIYERLIPYRDEFGADAAIRLSDSTVVGVTSVGGAARISATRLLELGVDPAIIEQAMTKTPYTRLNISIADGE